MGTLTAAGRRTAYGEDAQAVVRALLGLTAGAGAFAAAAAASTGQLPLIGLPTLALLGLLLAGASITWAASAAVGIWTLLLPAASGEGILVPLTMIVVCLALALGPDRLLSWLARDAAPGSAPRVEDRGWIEEDEVGLG
jgi:hypothetical protein